MTRAILIWAFLTLCWAEASAQTPAEAVLSKEPLSAERLDIYRQFLVTYNNGSPSTLNVSQTTRAFAPDAGDRAGCLTIFKPHDLVTPAVHSFSADTFAKYAVKLVDPLAHKIRDPGDAIRRGKDVDGAVDAGFAAGLFTFSEIVFDSSHTHAALSYSFVCGGLCGHGGVVIYNLHGGKWQASSSHCARWIS